MDTRVLVIGYGSTLRGDDAAGPRVAELLRDRLDDRGAVKIRTEASLTPELASDVAAVEHVIFVDCAADLAPGRVVESVVAGHDPVDSTPAMVHFLDPPALLRWTRELYGTCPDALQFAIGGGSFEISDTLTPPVATACLQVVERVCNRIDEFLLYGEVSRA